MDDIAALASVAKSTVSRALKGDPRVKPATRERIVALARQHGYAVNSNARKLRQRRTNTIAVVMHLPPNVTTEWTGPFVFQLLADVANGLWMRHQDLLLCSPESEDPMAYQTLLASKGVDGIIFLGQGPNDEWLIDLVRTDAPFVVWGSVSDDPRYCTIGSDNIKGGMLVGRRFAAMRRSRILFVGNTTHPEMKQRLEGLKAGLEEAGRPYSLQIVEVSDFSFETALDEMGRYLATGDERPDAIFAASDAFAMAAMAVIQSDDLRIPDDVSIIGYDDIPTAARMRPALTTVRQDTRQGGNLLVEKLFQRIDGGDPASVTLPTELIVRDT